MIVPEWQDAMVEQPRCASCQASSLAPEAPVECAELRSQQNQHESWPLLWQPASGHLK